MKTPLLHRFLGLAEIYATLKQLYQWNQQQDSRLAEQEKTMETIQSDIDSLAASEAAMEKHITDLDTEIKSLQGSVVPGATITDDQKAALDALAAKSAAFVAGFTPAPVAPTDAPPSTGV